jgi:hypothetical protein
MTRCNLKHVRIRRNIPYAALRKMPRIHDV